MIVKFSAGISIKEPTATPLLWISHFTTSSLPKEPRWRVQLGLCSRGVSNPESIRPISNDGWTITSHRYVAIWELYECTEKIVINISFKHSCLSFLSNAEGINYLTNQTIRDIRLSGFNVG